MSKPEHLMSQDTFEKHGGHSCPVCRSKSIEVEPGTLTADGEFTWDDVQCSDCDSTWREFFRCIEYGKLVVGDRLKSSLCSQCGRGLGEHSEEGDCPDTEPKTDELYVLVNLAHQTGQAYVMTDGDECIAYPTVEAAVTAQKRIFCESEEHTPETARLFKLVPVPPTDVAAARLPDQQPNGWFVATVPSAGKEGETILEIEKDDAAGVFESDADAIDHVMHQACREADPEARAAIREIVESWSDAP